MHGSCVILLGHRALGAMEVIGSLVVWSSALILMGTGEQSGLFMGTLLLVFYNGVDAALTYFMPKKGYMLALSGVGRNRPLGARGG